MDIKGKILDAVDGDGTLRKTIADNPLDLHPAPPPVPVPDLPAAGTAGVLEEVAVGVHPVAEIAAPAVAAGPPSFIPPGIAAEGLPKPPPPPPSFVPPARWRPRPGHGGRRATPEFLPTHSVPGHDLG